MKKLSAFFIIIISLLIIISCNSKKEVPLIHIDTLPESPALENNEQTDPQQNWKELFLSSNKIETEEDVEVIKLIIEKADQDNRLEELQKYLEEEATKDKVPPQILFGLSLVYGRKGLVKEEYKIIEKLEEKVKQAPQIAFNLSLVYGRKETLKSQIDKVEAEALALLQGFISVTSEPTGADVLIEGELKGTTPFTTEGIGEGSYYVEIRKEKYSTINRNVSVKAGETTEIIEKLVLLPGSLVINSDPVGSTVLLDGKEIGGTPLNITEMKAGKYEITIKKNNYTDIITTIVIEPGKLETIDIKLSASMGILSFTNLTDGAIIILNETRVYPEYETETGIGILKDIPTGSHELTIRKDGYRIISTIIKINSDTKTTINGKLIQITPYNNVRFKKKLYLDGNGDYGEIRYSSNLNLRSKISIEAWVYMDDLSINSDGKGTWGYRDSRPVISQCHDGSTAGNYTFGVTPNELFFAFETIDSRYTGSFKFEEERWYNIAVTHDFGNGSSTKFYVDGKIIRGSWVDDTGNKISGDTLPERNTRGSYYIGTYNPNVVKKFFSGYIDELRVWDSIREKGEISLALSEEIYLPKDGLILYYKFNNLEDRTLMNHAGNNNLKLMGDASILN